ncbi:MAG: hypothetical protein E6H01_11335 [Bacillati bacterium ANGP1]|uniref:Carboxypeptidase regulatory-like domain-containing protein n=1 Tax=Candidatus Segetimicrobium genomatis TaxID=2569760 RepID=A0A537KU59_9BACT|nr:MAG: hypothetical protein E6H01_11335 [Terrabacteria group bacterium ANGP1]
MRVALACCAAIGLLVGVSAAAGSAALQVTGPSPLTIRGVFFVPSERVTVVAHVKGRYVMEVTADKAGTFTARFTGVSLSHCLGYTVRATGSRGSHAYLRSLPECASPGPAP